MRSQKLSLSLTVLRLSGQILSHFPFWNSDLMRLISVIQSVVALFFLLKTVVFTLALCSAAKIICDHTDVSLMGFGMDSE